jgi:hypothetical protein
MLVYTLIAASRGINVCDCFGCCCGRDDDEEKPRLPSRNSDMNTIPEGECSGSDTGNNRTRPETHQSYRPPGAPFPSYLPQHAAEGIRSSRLQQNLGKIPV